MIFYSDESGLLLPNKKRPPYFGLGGISIEDAEVDKAKGEIRELREKFNYYLNFEYKVNNKFKIPFCRALMDWYFSKPTIGFFAIVLRVGDLDWSYWERGSQQPYNACYTYFYRKMINSFIKDYVESSQNVSVIIDKQSLNQKELRNRFEYFQEESAIIKCEEIHSYTDDLLQLADFLLSSVVNRFTLLEHPTYTRCSVKNGLSEYLMFKLNRNYFWNWRRVGQNWGPSNIEWISFDNYPNWERPKIPGTRPFGHKFDLFSWHGN